jgi:eukaryotic-like serine/threonine-protein kinase
MDTKEHEEGGLQRGDIIADKYRVEQEIGRGGMGVVVAATHLDLDQRVAIKVLQKSAAYNQDAMARFLREARAAAKIRSEHVARVMDVGKLSDGLTYIVMEFLDGSDLADVLVKDGPMRITTAADYVLQACEGIAAAHAAGIIHRDIKPANLFLARQPGRTNVVKILDFGVSKFSRNAIIASDGSATQTGQVFGSPIYMSPEQLDSTIPIDGRTDIWALGIVLYELLAGKPPFYGKSSANIMTSIMRDPAPKLRAIRADVPEALEEVVMRCLEKDRDQRFSTVIDLAEAIAPFCGKGADDTVNRIYQILAESAAAPGETTFDDTLGKTDASPSKSTSSGKQSERRGSGPRRDSGEPSPSIGGSSHTHGGLNPQSKRRIAAVGFVGVAALVAAGATLSTRTSPPVPSPAVQPPPEASQAKVVAPPVVSEAPMATATAVQSAKTTSNEVTITFTGAPPATKVFRGEVELGPTEKPLLLPRSSDKIVLRFVADAFATTEMELIPNVDQTLAISLKPAKPSATTPIKRKVPKELEPF